MDHTIGYQEVNHERQYIALFKSPANQSPNELTHLDEHGQVNMVDVGDKAVTKREAQARAVITVPDHVAEVLEQGGDTKKGNVFTIARIAGIQGAKRCSDLIPSLSSFNADID